MKIVILVILNVLLLTTLKGQDKLTFKINVVQNGDTFNISDNIINLEAKEFSFYLTLPAYMEEFEGEKFSSINYIATTSESYFKSMIKTKCFRCDSDYTPFAYDKHNSGKCIIVSNTNYSFWNVSEKKDEYNVSSYQLTDSNITAQIIVKSLYLDVKKVNILMKKFKGTVYMVFEAVNRDSSVIGKRTYVTINIK